MQRCDTNTDPINKEEISRIERTTKPSTRKKILQLEALLETVIKYCAMCNEKQVLGDLSREMIEMSVDVSTHFAGLEIWFLIFTSKEGIFQTGLDRQPISTAGGRDC